MTRRSRSRSDGRREDTAILAGRIARARADPGRSSGAYSARALAARALH
jgi:hypothetical protein